MKTLLSVLIAGAMFSAVNGFASPSRKKPMVQESDWGILRLPAQDLSKATMLCFHGYGGDREIAHVLRSYAEIEESLIAFDFPDAGYVEGDYAPEECAFGTLREIEPPLRLLYQLVIDEGLDTVYLYGFSAGGGAVINTLAALHNPAKATYLDSLGIDEKTKIRIMDAIRRGIVILDCPLKSLEEIIAARGASYELEVLSQTFKRNKMTPIDSLMELEGFGLNILLYFEDPDEVLSNRLDATFIQRLRQANKTGTTRVLIGTEGGHNGYHTTLWQEYAAWTAARQKS